jgi:hypothetical protein
MDSDRQRPSAVQTALFVFAISFALRLHASTYELNHVVIVAIAGQKMNVHSAGRRRRHADALHRPRDMASVRRNGDSVECPDAVQVIEERIIALLLRVCEGGGQEQGGEGNPAHRP